MSLTIEEVYLIQILHDFINQLVTLPSDDIDWQNLYELSKNHEVTGVVYYQCKEFISKDNLYEYEQAYAASLFYYSNIKIDINRVLKILNDYSIRAFIVKGLEVSQYYPLPYLRTMGDVDIVIEHGNKEKAIMILSQIGFEGSNDTATDTWCGQHGELNIEVHDTLIKRLEYTDDKQTAFFNNYMDYYQDGCVDWNFHFLFLIMHLRKHFMAEGVGLRQFMDIAAVIRNNPNLKWDWIEEHAIDLNIQRFVHSCYGLIYRWFGVKAPVDFEEMQELTFEEVTKTIMRDGVFGYADDDREYRARNAMLFNRGPIWLRRVVFMLKRLFPCYEDMIGYPGCGFLRGKAYLLPLAWLVRFKYIIMDKNEISRMHTFKSAFMSKEDYERRKALFEKLGVM